MGVLIVSCCFILADVITGLVKAFYCHNVNSTILRKGLYHKIAELMALGVGYGVDFAANYYNFGWGSICVPVCVYICGMEFISVVENLTIINPDLLKFFQKYLDKIKGGSNDEL